MRNSTVALLHSLTISTFHLIIFEILCELIICHCSLLLLQIVPVEKFAVLPSILQY